jgi:predicted lipid-binding transport protein (Tim44 family)
MKRLLMVALAAITAVVLVAADSADARRMGSGRSLGAQRPVTPPSASPNVAPANPVAPAQALPPAAAPATSGGSRWMGPLAGLAAGIGLAALLSHFGLSEGFASVLMLMLLVVGGIYLIRMFVGRRDVVRAPMQYAAVGAAPGAMPPPSPASGTRIEPTLGSVAAPAESPSAGQFPPGFDPAPFVQQATLQFRKLQAAYDVGDRNALADVMTPELFAEIDKEITERGPHVATEVDVLEAAVLDVTNEGDRYWASVHFTGTLREDGMLLGKPFDEVWNLVKPVDGKTGWLLAGIRQLA